MRSHALRALIVEDSSDDANLIVRLLDKAGYEVTWERVESEAELRRAMSASRWDVVLSDFAMPGFSGLDAFAIVRSTLTDIPFIFVSGHIGEERAADAMRRGVNDYVLKGNLNRLVPAIEHQLAETESRRRQRETEANFRQSERRYRALVEHSPQGIVIVQGNRIVFSNARLGQIFMAVPGDAFRTVEELSGHFAPAERERLARLFSGAAVSGQDAKAEEFRGERSDGNAIVLQLMVSPIEWEDAPALQLILSDVSELKQREEELRTQKRLLDTVLSTMPQFLTVKDRDLRYLLVNQRVELNTGKTAEQLMGKTFADQGVGTAEERERIDALDRQVIESGIEKSEKAFPVTGRDGTPCYYDVVRSPLRDETGQVTGLVTIYHDVSDLERAESALRESQRLLRAVFDSLPVWVTLKDRERRYVISNSYVEQVLGLRPRDIIGKRFEDLALADPTDARASIALDQAILDGGPATEEFDGERHVAHGEVRRYHIRRAPLRNEHGEIQGLIVVSADVTERANAEEALARQGRLLRTVFDSLPLWVTVKERDGTYITANQAFLRDLRLNMRDVVGQRLDQIKFAEPDTAKRLRELEEKVFETGVPDVQTAFPLRLTDGRRITTQALRAPLVDPNGKVEGIIIVTEDVTEREMLEHQLRESQKMESIGRLAGGVAHDFNNMLAVIMSFSELVIDSMGQDDPLRADMSEILKAANRAAGITRQLLAFSRRQVLEMHPVDLNAVITALERLLGRLLGETIQLGSSLQPDLPLVNVDEVQIEQVLLNLAVNARDAMPGGGRLQMETRVVTLDESIVGGRIDVQPGTYVELDVTDNGVGMDEAVRSQIFEPFFTTKEKGKGTGLGLSTVYGIVKQFGGNIAVYSEPGRGTSFKLYLPLADAKSHVPARPAVHAPHRTPHESILLVEDEEVVRVAATRILESSGYTVHTAPCAEDALAMLPWLPDDVELLLTDVVMTGMDGVALANKARMLRPRLCVLLMSGYSDLTLRQRGESAGRLPYLQKPFTRGSLLSKVRDVLDASEGDGA